MITAQHLISNIQCNTRPPKRTMPGEYTTRKDISLDKLLEACEQRGADLHDVIALAMTKEARENKESGMTLRAQAELAWKVLDKAEPSKQAIKSEVELSGEVQVRRVERQIVDPKD